MVWWVGALQLDQGDSGSSPVGGRLGLGTEPCYESAGDLHRVKQAIISIVAQNLLNNLNI